MLRGYRFFVAAACGLVLFTALGIGAYFGSLYAPDHKQYQAISSNKGEQGDYRGPSETLPDIAGLPGPVERAMANPHPGDQTDRETRDLAAQEASALWAFWMVVASFASVAITAVGTVFLYKQIVLTREAVEDTGKATKAMERQNELAEAETRLALRPYVWFGKMEIRNVAAGQEPEFHIEIGHAGQTPAFEIRSFVSFGLLDLGLLDAKLRFDRNPHRNLSSKTQMFPNHPGLEVDRKLGRAIDDQTVTELRQGFRRFIVAGIVSYKDTFGKRHLTTFKSVSLQFISADIMSTSPCNRGNNAS